MRTISMPPPQRAGRSTDFTHTGRRQISADGRSFPTAGIARRIVRLAQQIASGGRFVGFDAVDAVLAFAVSNSQDRSIFPDIA